MDAFLKATLGAIITNPQAGLGWVFSIYLLWRLHQLTDRQHEAAVKTAGVLSAIKTFLVTKFGGDLSE